MKRLIILASVWFLGADAASAITNKELTDRMCPNGLAGACDSSAFADGSVESASKYFYGMGYVTGVADAEYGISFCPEPKVTASQLAAIYIKWLREHPAELHKNAGWTVAMTINAAFPCKKK